MESGGKSSKDKVVAVVGGGLVRGKENSYLGIGPTVYNRSLRRAGYSM